MSHGSRIALKGISKSYGAGSAGLPVIERLEFMVPDQEIVTIVGPSGAGKTTLLNIAAGFVQPDAGEVLVDGKAVTGPGPERCVVFQQYAVFPWLTVRKNIEFGLTLRGRRVPRSRRDDIVDHYLELLGLRDFADAYPKTLSGGMKQRVAIGRAYAVNPEILLMDEPFGALDAQTRVQMQEQLLGVMEREKKTVLFITHAVEEAIYLGHRVIVLTRRPARILEDIRISLPYPRSSETRTSARFNELRRHVEALLLAPEANAANAANY
jgi:NitT/TauT family transport system ATP-binding protein